MKYFLLLLLCIFFSVSKSQDTLYVEDVKHPRLLLYKDSIQAYQIAFSVAKNVADSVRARMGNNSLDAYFLTRFTSNTDADLAGYFFNWNDTANVQIGHVNDSYRGIKDDDRFPWRYLETQYKRLDSIKIKPAGIMEGGELPNVYVYLKPSTTVIYKKVKHFTVVDQTIQFFKKNDGKTRVSFIRKFYYSEFDKLHQRIDSVEKLDPVTKQHLFY
jgi:hypothetical protein